MTDESRIHLIVRRKHCRARNSTISKDQSYRADAHVPIAEKDMWEKKKGRKTELSMSNAEKNLSPFLLLLSYLVKIAHIILKGLVTS